jgi:hypothetical protein
MEEREPRWGEVFHELLRIHVFPYAYAHGASEAFEGERELHESNIVNRGCCFCRAVVGSEGRSDAHAQLGALSIWSHTRPWVVAQCSSRWAPQQ